MANALYDKGRNRFARGEIAWKATGGDTIRACFLKDDYAKDLAAHEYFSDLGPTWWGMPEGATRADCPQLTLARSGWQASATQVT